MTFFKIVLLIAIMGGSLPSYAKNTLPDFSQFPVSKKDVFKGKPAPVVLSSHAGARIFRTVLRKESQKGPNFAGHYTVVSIGCGTQCQVNWVIDAKSGKILGNFVSEVGLQFQLDSALLIVNPPEPELKKAYEEHPDQPVLGTMDTAYMTLKNNMMKTIHKDKWVNVIKVAP